MAFLIEISDYDLNSGLSQIFISRPETALQLSGDGYEFLAWGDPVCTDGFGDKLQAGISMEFIVNNIYGHYYYIFFDRKKQEFITGNSLFSILPLYYCSFEGKILLSDSALALGYHTGMKSVSKRFVLETLLFNYPLFNRSLIEGISLLPSNSGMIIAGGGMRIVKHTSIQELFCNDALLMEVSAGMLADVFLETVKKYLPGEQYYAALTGGFDSRALTAAGLYYGKLFTTYCFGTTGSDDLRIAEFTAEKTGLSFSPVILDEDYLKEKSLEAGGDFITRSSGVATFTRAHYMFAASKLSLKASCIVTGNFGSEILRAAHVPGVVISPALYEVFNSGGPEEAMAVIRKTGALKYLNLHEFNEEINSLEQDLETLPCFDQRYKYLTRNGQFYVFVFEEVFRKYFGTEIASLSGFIRNRTPFLDIDFLKVILSSRFAGVYSGFFEHNPFRRFKGQVLYASIIRKAFPALGKLPVDRGYRPDDLISFYGRANIIRAYMGRLLTKKDSRYDPYGVKRAWELNKRYYMSLPVNRNLFNNEAVRNLEISGLTDEAARLYSLIFIENRLNNG